MTDPNDLRARLIDALSDAKGLDRYLSAKDVQSLGVPKPMASDISRESRSITTDAEVVDLADVWTQKVVRHREELNAISLDPVALADRVSTPGWIVR